MKKILIIFVICYSTQFLYSQILYDDNDIRETSARIFGFSQDTRWASSTISFFFINGTNDLENNQERIAVMSGIKL